MSTAGAILHRLLSYFRRGGTLAAQPARGGPPGVSLVRRENLDRLYRAAVQAQESGKLPERHGGVIAHVAWFHVMIGELEELDRLVEGLLLGDGDAVVQLRERLRDAPALSLAGDQPFPHPEGDFPCPFRQLNPFETVAAGAILGHLHDDPGAVERAIGYYLARAAPIGTVLHAAERLHEKEIGLDEFAMTLLDSQPAPGEHGHGSEPQLDHQGGHGPTRGPLPFPQPQRWDPCTLDWARCAFSGGQLADEVVGDSDVPVLIGSISPESVCHGQAATLTLSPLSGTSFPAQQPAGSECRLVLDDGQLKHTLIATAWSSTSITVQLPNAIGPGCATIYWESAGGAGSRLADAVDARGDQCASRFPTRPLGPRLPKRPGSWGRVQVAIVRAPYVRFTSGGDSVVTAAACDPVTLDWTISAGLCGGDAAVYPPGGGGEPQATQTGGYARISLSADGQTLLSQVPLSGTLTVIETGTKTYTLTVETYAGQTLCGSATETVSVTRVSSVELAVPDRVHRPGRTVPVTVRIPCAASTGGVQVTLTSSDTTALASGSALVPPGEREISVRVAAAGTQFKQVQLSGSAPGHQTGVVTVLVGPTSCLPQGSVPDIRKYGGEWKVEVVVPQVVGIHMAILHTGEVLLFNYREGTIGGGGGAILQCVKTAQAALRQCDVAWGNARRACNTARDAQLARCDEIFACSTAEQCGTVTCPPCTGGGPARWVCEAGRGLCLLGCHTARIACEGLRALCKFAVGVVHAACDALAWLTMAACKVGVVVGTAACTIVAGGQAFRDWLLGRAPAPDELAYNIGHSSRASCVLWNPKTNAVTNVPLGRNLFCAGHAFLPDGRLLVAAGQFPAPLLDGVPLDSPAAGRGVAYDLNVFDPVSRSWTRLPDMAEGRWYPTAVTLDDGRVLVMSGNNAIFAGADGTRDSLEIFSVSGSPPMLSRGPYEQLPGIPIQGRVPYRWGWCYDWHFYHLYPFAHVLPNRTVFVHWKRRTADFYPARPAGSFRWGWHWQGPLYGGPCAGQDWKYTKHQYSRTGPGPGTSVILPLKPRPAKKGGFFYPPARIMIVGGGGREGTSDPPVPGEVQDLDNTHDATKTSEILDYGQLDIWGIPTWRWTGTDQANPSFMRHGRVMPDTVLLPDGKVLVVNGAEKGMSGGFLIHFGEPLGASNPALHAEIFDPDDETWDELCKTSVERLYHATALLLPDARVAVAGHDGFLNMPQPNASRYEIETFSPPYLFRGPRPVIASAPASVAYGTSFSIDVDNPSRIVSVALLRGASVTHQTNTDQRYVALALNQSGPRTLSLQAPPHGGIAPPGYYMLFVVDANGVPSEATWVRVG